MISQLQHSEWKSKTSFPNQNSSFFTLCRPKGVVKSCQNEIYFNILDDIKLFRKSMNVEC